MGYYEGKEAGFAGKVRADLRPQFRREVLGKLKQLQVKKCPFPNLPDTDVGRWDDGITADQMHDLHSAKPELVAQIKLGDWMAESGLRHAAFLGLRVDKPAKDVRREH